MDKLRSLLWINWQRLKRGHGPVFSWPVNERDGEARRSQMCPVAQMLPLDEKGWVADIAVAIDGEHLSMPTPEYLRRTIRRFDEELSEEV